MTDLPKSPMTPSRDIHRLLDIMAALRTPGSGCPWDLEQTFGTIAPYTIEEAYEVADAIARSDLDDLRDELGDLLFQVVYHARLASEQQAFDFGDVVEGVTAKMIRRHPHVFSDTIAANAGAVNGLWDRIKEQERAARHDKNGGDSDTSLLTSVPVALPALTRAIKLQNKAAKVGFDWPGLQPVFSKMREELAELEAELSHPVLPTNTERVVEEFGDLLFVMANVARHLNIDAESALQAANGKFIRRFAHIETRLSEQGLSPAQSTLAEMDALWDEAKTIEKARVG